jgi:Holliday junction resolvasome RuvABC ATP-dependent DNA helicase subunit
MIQNTLKDVVGQDRAKKLLNFYITSQNKTGVIDPLFFASNGGSGKTHIANAVGEHLVDPSGQKKPFIEVNGASLKNLRQFVESLIVPHIANNKPVTLFIDELHSVDESILDWLLSVLQPSDNYITNARFDTMVFHFDFRYFSFISASTNPEAISRPLKSRLRRIELDPYSGEDLSKILEKNSPKIVYKDDVQNDIISVVRGSPRLTVQYAKDIVKYTEQIKRTSFDKTDWKNLRETLGIRPLGLNTNEIELLKYLRDSGPQTLTAIAARLGLDTSTVRRDIELFLLHNGFIVIDKKRSITPQGQNILNQC